MTHVWEKPEYGWGCTWRGKNDEQCNKAAVAACYGREGTCDGNEGRCGKHLSVDDFPDAPLGDARRRKALAAAPGTEGLPAANTVGVPMATANVRVAAPATPLLERVLAIECPNCHRPAGWACTAEGRICMLRIKAAREAPASPVAAPPREPEVGDVYKWYGDEWTLTERQHDPVAGWEARGADGARGYFTDKMLTQSTFVRHAPPPESTPAPTPGPATPGSGERETVMEHMVGPLVKPAAPPPTQGPGERAKALAEAVAVVREYARHLDRPDVPAQARIAVREAASRIERLASTNTETPKEGT